MIWCAGQAIPQKWSKRADGVWQVDLSGVGPAAWNFRQLFVNDQRAIRARFPNADTPNPFLYATGGDLDHALIAPELVKPSWGNARDAQINLVPQWRFFNQWNTVTKVDAATGRIDFADSERHAKVIPGNWFWIEGVREELDQPGEWFFDQATRRLHYLPTPGVDPNTLEIFAPVLNRIVNAQGDVNAGTHVQHVHFDGITFRHTEFSLGHIEARVHTDTAIMFENTLDCSVRNCRFENIGGYALWLHLDSRRNKFDRNTVRHSGGGGVLMTGARLSYMDDTKIYTPAQRRPRSRPSSTRSPATPSNTAAKSDTTAAECTSTRVPLPCRWSRETSFPTITSTTSRAMASSLSATRAGVWWSIITSTMPCRRRSTAPVSTSRR